MSFRTATGRPSNVRSWRPLVVTGILVCVALATTYARAEDSTTPRYETVQQILARHCYACHGPGTQEGDLRLDIRSRALNSAVVPGDVDASPLFQRITAEDTDLRMPPREAGDLNQDEISQIRRWIAQGAAWPDEFAGTELPRLTTEHWSFQPLRPTTPPPIMQLDDIRARNEIDQFIFAQLRQRGLTPSPPADRSTWIRRVYLDVHGLAPTERETAAFVADTSPDAFGRVVDRVLTSHHYGERWARHWLDVVRFGESTGFEVNRDRPNAWYFRDYVIRSFNHDKSFREFVREQLAGDALDADVATGFLVGGPYDMVKSPDINLTLMQRQDELADIVNTTSTAFLGLTVGCARCHNHKFDPVLQRDYYAMQAVFAGVDHGERRLLSRLTAADRRQLATLDHEIPELDRQLVPFRNAAMLRRQSQQLANAGVLGASELWPPVRAERNEDRFGSVTTTRIRFTIDRTSSAQPCLDELEVYLADSDTNVALASSGTTATSSGDLTGYPIHQLKHINDGRYGNNHSWIANTSGTAWVQLEFPEPVEIDRVVWGRDRLGQFRDRIAIDYRIEVAVSQDVWKVVSSSENRLPPSDEPSPIDDDILFEFLEGAQRLQAQTILQHYRSLKEERDALLEDAPLAYVGTFREPTTVHRLYRGDPMAPREEVAPDILTVSGTLGLSSRASEQERRQRFADWVASNENPLTARVIVNRVWQHHFGTGIVSTSSDFGKNGTPPSHPELLDWLAWRLIENDWSLKWLHRKILTSHTYRQSSRPRSHELRVDASAGLLWRFPPRRMEAEVIRDRVLQASGLLNLRYGGPSFLLLEIDHENVHHYFPLREFGHDQYRRMIYMMKIRQEYDNVFGVFDCPDGGQVIPSRSRSTTPLQALNLLNSQFMLDQAAAFADRLRRETDGSQSAIVRRAFMLAYSRPPTTMEAQLSVEFLNAQGAVALCRALLNSNEFLFLP